MRLLWKIRALWRKLFQVKKKEKETCHKSNASHLALAGSYFGALACYTLIFSGKRYTRFFLWLCDYLCYSIASLKQYLSLCLDLKPVLNISTIWNLMKFSHPNIWIFQKNWSNSKLECQFDDQCHKICVEILFLFSTHPKNISYLFIIFDIKNHSLLH
jgi:hypothetical protein